MPVPEPRSLRRWLTSAGLSGFAFASTATWLMRPGAAQLALVAAAGLGVALICLTVRRRRGLGAAALLMLAVAGLVRGGTSATPSSVADLASTGSTPGTIVGVVTGTDSPGVVVEVGHIVMAAESRVSSGRILVTGRLLPAFVVGDQVTLTVSALRLAGSRPGSRSMEALERDGIDAIATVTAATIDGADQGLPRWMALLRAHIRQAVDSQLGEPAATLVLGIGMGIHQPIDPVVRSSLQDAGLYHIVAVSGLKIIVLLGLIDALGGVFAWSPRRRRMVGLAGVATYVLLSGSGAAALRSALMAAMAFAVRRDGRRLDPIVGLAALAALLCGLEPRIGLDVGFQLSFLGTAGILLIAPRLQARLPGPRILIDPLAVTLAAQIATAPIIAATFGVISIVGPLANALMLPFLPLLVATAVIGPLVAVVAPAVAWLPLHVAALLAGAAVGLAQLLTGLPGSAVHVGQWPRGWVVAEVCGVAAGSIVALATARRSWRAETRVAVAGMVAALCGLASALVVGGSDGHAHITVLDVGAASAVLVETADGHRALVDAGGDSGRLLTALGRVLSPLDTRIDLVVMTGSDRRVAGGLGGLAGHYSVGTVAVPTAASSGEAAAVAALSAAGARVISGATSWRWGGIDWSCVGAAADTPAIGCLLRINADSGWRVILTGVVPPLQQDSVADLGPLWLGADLVVAPPGGALSPTLLAAVRPRLVATPSAANSRGIRVDAAVTASSTGVDGDLRYSTDPSGGFVAG